jgi:enoyl reductase-like protein
MLLQPILIFLSSCSGLEDVLEDTIPMRISISQFWQHIMLSAGMTALASSPVLALAGSGFCFADDVWEYLTGDWSVERFRVQPIPFDGFLFASCIMVAKKAHASSSIKDLIVTTAGIEEGAWEGTYTKSMDGILTI